MRVGDVQIDTAEGPMRAYRAVPDGARAAVVVVQEAFGVNAHIEDVTRRVAAAGYHALAPDLFHRSPDGIVEYGDFGRVVELFAPLRDETILTDLDAAFGHVRAAGFPAERTGVVGFCFGGRATFLVALRRRLGAAVGFYGGGIVTSRFQQFPALVDEAAELRTPWLGLFGDEDASIPVDDVQRLRAALGGTTVDTEVVRYPGAKHGFHCDARADFHPKAAADAWGRTLDWFSRHL